MPKMSFIRPVANARRLHGLFKNRVLIWDMLKDILKRRYRPTLLNFLIFIAGSIYIFFPMDAMPDIIPVIGWVDDGAVVFFLAKRLLNEAEKYMKWKSAQVTYIIPLEAR